MERGAFRFTCAGLSREVRLSFHVSDLGEMHGGVDGNEEDPVVGSHVAEEAEAGGASSQGCFGQALYIFDVGVDGFVEESCEFRSGKTAPAARAHDISVLACYCGAFGWFWHRGPLCFDGACEVPPVESSSACHMGHDLRDIEVMLVTAGIAACG